MNWIIRSTKIVEFHTNLHKVLKPIWDNLIDYDWVLADLDFMSDNEIPINFERDYFILKREEFDVIYQSRTQMIWGVISAIPKNTQLDPGFISNLSAEDEKVWKVDQYLIKESYVEIIAIDSSYTIIKFKDEKLSDKFKEYFQDQAIDLQAFN
ncbi:hypothetical protein EG346_13890 [Chryseobacterium carnipullorum]|uniref:DUF2691 family protein n=1 Tax=Chryseobacterium carnipullorum TaxID=1124835 RepID=A0A376DQT4_CHRCU|nr:hypothetical protein [Chryseobacterium carnipullorum]AZA49199.1 hypothetical protein EG346_13890 [Chryseobacterium carnipullorum]AZA64095.1 hypothetical protein EG345_04820 [Chryseobacterium carnipullorum]STC94006.1 Uncharacterised protein [Chryseobacterium carnipullorum]